MNWDDLKFFLALARHRTLSHAATELGVNHATVSRRIEGLERRAGAKVFRKTKTGFRLTAFGDSLLGPAIAAEASFHNVERAVRNADNALVGEVRVSTSQLLAESLLLPSMRELRAVHPEILVDVIEATHFADLDREADIALRLHLSKGAPGDSNVRVRYLGALAWALYCAPEHANTALSALPTISYDAHAPGRPDQRWIAEKTASANVVMYASSMYVVRGAVEAGLGAGVLPRIWAQGRGLTCRSETVSLSHAYVAIHPDLRDNTRIAAVFDQLVDFAACHRELFDG